MAFFPLRREEAELFTSTIAREFDQRKMGMGV